jgi:type III pantothenate kinase
MLLTIDIGNTNIVLGIYDKKDLKSHWRLSSLTTRTNDECWIMMTTLLQQAEIKPTMISGVIISSVVPNITPAFIRMSEINLNIDPVIVTGDLDFGLKCLYDDPRAVGADRLVNAVAGYHLFKGPLILVDFGTATTFDIVSENFEYLGGIIAPGIESSASLLHRVAARLPKVEMKFPNELIGRNTEASIQSGLMYGTVEMIDGMINRLKSELGSHTKTAATGGLANVVIPYCNTISRIEPLLTLVGLRLIYERVSS